MAWITTFKTQAELTTIAEKLEAEPFKELVEGIRRSREFFENFVTILMSAECRVLCAASVVELREVGSLDETP
jgi:hypothetical protein